MKGCMKFITRGIWTFLALIVVGTGCKTAAITNLTPSQVPRDPNGEYRFEVAWERIQQNVRPQSVQPNLVVGMQEYPMTESPVATNRWEANVILPAGTDHVNYFYKFNYEYAGFLDIKKSNARSSEYRLKILEVVVDENEMGDLGEYTGSR